jgi:hypothetical protein
MGVGVDVWRVCGCGCVCVCDGAQRIWEKVSVGVLVCGCGCGCGCGCARMHTPCQLGSCAILSVLSMEIGNRNYVCMAASSGACSSLVTHFWA